MSIQQIGVRRVIITRPGPQGTNGGVASIFGRIGTVVADPGDYDELTDLTVTGEFNLTCEADDTVHRLRVDKVGSEYVLRLVSPLIALLFVFLTFAAHAATRDAVMVDTNGVLRYPTNIFAVNSNDLNSAVNRDSSLLTGTLPTNTIPAGISWLAWSNLFSALQYFAEGLHIAPNKPLTFGGETRTNWPTGGSGGGSLTVAGDTGNPVSNLVGSATTRMARTNGDVAVEITAVPAPLLTGTIDILRMPSEAATDSEVAVAMGALTNGTGTLNISNLNVTGTLNTGGLTVPTNAYSSTWATNTEVPTKRDLYAKIETLGTGGGSSNTFGSLTLSGRRAWPLVDDLIGGSSTLGDCGAAAQNNSGTVIMQASEPGHQGMRRLRVTAPGAPAFGWGVNGSYVLLTNSGSDKWVWECEFKTHSNYSGDAGVDYGIFHGFINYTGTTNNPTDGIFFAYQTNYTASSTNWVFVTMTSSTAQATDTGVAFTPSSFCKMRWVMDHTNVVATINGVAVATNTTQIPFGVSLVPHIKLTETGASGTRDVYLDALLVDHAD